MVTLQDIQAAQKQIAPYIKPTPLVGSKFLSDLCNSKVYLKLENEQYTSSFKMRGVINKLLQLSKEQKAMGVITASAGNHGQAVALGAQKLGFKAKIVVPKPTPKVKIEGIEQYGAELLLYGETYTEAERKAKELAHIEGRLYISPYNDEQIIAGHGTIGLEILKERPELEVVVVPVGGGGLISGISIALKSLKPDVKVFGVQSTATPIMFESLRAGAIVIPHRHEPRTVAEGLSGSIEKDSITFPIVQQYTDKVFLVREEAIRHAVVMLWENDALKVEGSAATTAALLIENKELFEEKTVALVLTGGNIDDSLFQTLLVWEGYSI
jgi:threonine dehydratase